MLEVAVIALRWLQYGGGVVLLGAPLFLLYSFKDADAPNLEWSRPTLRLAAIIVAWALVSVTRTSKFDL